MTSIDDIITLLQDKVQAFSDFRQRDRIFKSIGVTVSILTPISAVASIADDAGLVCQNVLNTCLAFLTFFTVTPTCKSDIFYSRHPTGRMNHSDVQVDQVADGVITSFDALAEMFESIEHFVDRLRIYVETSRPTPALDQTVVRLMVELISTLALVT